MGASLSIFVHNTSTSRNSSGTSKSKQLEIAKVQLVQIAMAKYNHFIPHLSCDMDFVGKYEIRKVRRQSTVKNDDGWIVIQLSPTGTIIGRCFSWLPNVKQWSVEGKWDCHTVVLHFETSYNVVVAKLQPCLIRSYQGLVQVLDTKKIVATLTISKVKLSATKN
jgi:hypothetical protein